MFSKALMANASYVACYGLLLLCGLMLISILTPSPPIIYSFKSPIVPLVLTVLFTVLIIVEMKKRLLAPLGVKQYSVFMGLVFVFSCFSLPSITWANYYFVQHTDIVLTKVIRKEHRRYGRAPECYKVWLKSELFDGSVCTSSQVFQSLYRYQQVEVLYQDSILGYYIYFSNE